MNADLPLTDAEMVAVFDEAIAEAQQGIYTSDTGLPAIVDAAVLALAELGTFATVADVQAVRTLFEATRLV